MLDREKLTKLLALTTSENDNEAVSCIRAANRMLKAAGMTWEEVLAVQERSLRVTIARAEEPRSEDWGPPHLSDKVMIDLMFRSIYSGPRTGNEDFWRFVDDVHEKFQHFGRLTPGQYQAIRNCYNQVLKRSR